jgi:hypothetical protein
MSNIRTLVKQLDSVEQGVINKSYDELIQMVIHLNNFRYDATANRTLELIEQKLLKDFDINQKLFQEYKDTKNIDGMFDVNNKWSELNSIYTKISMCIKSDNPRDIEYWLENI